MVGYRIREDLPENAIIIEKTQAVIRYVIKRAVTEKTSWDIVDAIIRKTVTSYTDKIKDEELKRKARKSLLSYATIQYRKAKTNLSALNMGLFFAFQTLAKKDAGEDIKVRAERIIETRAPLLTRQIKAQYIEIAQPLRMYSKDYMKQVESVYRDLATSEAKDSYSDKVSLRNVAEMAERYRVKQDELLTLKEQGVDLVWISTHANCSERCERWQGKLYSISGKSGVIDGIPYQPLSNAMDQWYTTKDGKRYRNGCISGFNCRHVLIPYKKGNKPIEVSSETVEKYRAIEETQRAMERAIREQQAVAIGLKDINIAQARAYALESKVLYKKYADYCNKNKVATYPARCKVFDGEELISPVYKRILNDIVRRIA